MAFRKFLLAAGFAALAVPASAAVTVIGSSSARMCFEAAEARSTPSLVNLAHCDEALEMEALSDHDRVATLVNRGILRLRVGDLEQSIADFDAAIADNPDEPEAYLNKGMASLRLPNGWEQAVPLFDRALEKRTRRPEIAYYGRAVANEMAGRVRQAYLDYRQASELAPNWRDPKVELARFTVRQP